MLLDSPDDADRLIAAVPLHRETLKIARRIAERCREVGIEIAYKWSPARVIWDSALSSAMD